MAKILQLIKLLQSTPELMAAVNAILALVEKLKAGGVFGDCGPDCDGITCEDCEEAIAKLEG